MCVFVSRPVNIVTFPRENGDHPKLVVDFLLVKDTFRKKKKETVKDFIETSYNNNGKPRKSSMILHFLFSSFFFIFPIFSLFCFFFFVLFFSRVLKI